MAWKEWNKKSAYLWIQAEPGHAQKVFDEVKSWEEAIGVWVVTGRWDVMVWLDASSWDEVYRRVTELRSHEWVKATSSHFVYKGMKNGRWWWDWPAGAWVLLRGPKLNGSMKQLTKWDWMVSLASVPGDWDCVAWAGAKNWDEVWKEIWDLNASGWQTQTLVPIRSWWNKSWKAEWMGAAR